MATGIHEEVHSATAEESAVSQGSSRKEPDTASGGRFLVTVLVAFSLLVVAFIGLPGLLSSDDRPVGLTHTVGRDDLVVSVIEQGTLESSNNTEITCKVRGFSTVTWVIDAGSVVEPGDELVRLDTKVIEEQLSLTKTNTFVARSTLARTQADAEKAEIAIDAYLKGRFRSQLQNLERQREIAERNLETAKKMHRYADELFQQGYLTDLEVDGNAYTVEQAQLELEVAQTQIMALQDYTRKMQLETLQGNLKAAQTKVKSDEAALKMEQARQARAQQELKDCIIRADRGGLVIYPSAAAWKNAPDVSQGATVRKDQVLLLMPDLEKMQVKVGIHESMIDRIWAGLEARVTLPEQVLTAEVSSVASVTRPAGWWTGNVVKYDTIIALPAVTGLKPGMSAEVEVILARHEDVLTLPVAAIVETERGSLCWVVTSDGPQRRALTLGDTDDVSVIVTSGIQEGEQVILNPSASIEEAANEALATLDQTEEDVENE